MKALLLTFVIFSFQANATFQCDLNVSVPEIEEMGDQKILGKGEHESQYNAKPISENKALQDCINNGGSNCQVINNATVCTYHSNGAGIFGGLSWVKETFSCTAIAQGTKKLPGRRLGKAEIAEKKKVLICQKIEECRNAALIDDSAPTSILEKLDYLEQRNECNH
jgi:hypothetical protein